MKSETTGVVVDTNIMVDMFLASRPRHAESVKLAELLKKRTVYLPMHGVFEIQSAIRSEKRRKDTFEFTREFSENNPFRDSRFPLIRPS
jgi:predicted nucleic acid-binding protein